MTSRVRQAKGKFVVTTQQVVGVIGLGQMGRQIAEAFRRSCRLVVYDIDAAAVSRLEAQGAVPVSSPRALAESVDVVVSVLPNGPDVRAVAEGDNGIFAAGRSGLLWIEMSTIDPEVTRTLAAEGRQRGVHVVDAPIGTMLGQGVSTFLFMVGGDADDVERVRPMLEQIGTVRRCGPVGQGVTMKLVNNLLAGVTYAASCEAVLLGLRAGLPLDTMLEVLSSTMADSPHLRRTIPLRVAVRDFAPGFRLDLQRKDADLALGLARQLGSPALLGAIVQELRSAAITRGLGGSDAAALVQVLEDLAGRALDRAPLSVVSDAEDALTFGRTRGPKSQEGMSIDE